MNNKCVMAPWCSLYGLRNGCPERAAGVCPLDRPPKGDAGVTVVDHTRDGTFYNAGDGLGRRQYGGAARAPLGPWRDSI